MSRKVIQDEFTALRISKQRKYQMRMQRDKRCTECGAEAVQGSRCLKHLVHARERQRKKRGLKVRYTNSLSYRLEKGGSGPMTTYGDLQMALDKSNQELERLKAELLDPAEAFEILAHNFPAIQVDCNSAVEAARFINGEVEKLKAQMAELEKDRARLDWMNRQQLGYLRGTNYPVWAVHGTTEHRQIAGDQTLRQAIDAAMTPGGAQ